MRGVLVGVGAYALAVVCAWAFSGSVLAPLSAVPIAVVGGLLAAHLSVKDADKW